MKWNAITYADLTAKQKENFNFQKLSAVLADYGYATIRLLDDWAGADFLAVHVGGDVLKVQLKGRLTFVKKYKDKELYVAFGESGTWYLYPHEELREKIFALMPNVGDSDSWTENGIYSFPPPLTKKLRDIMHKYRIKGDTQPISES